MTWIKMRDELQTHPKVVRILSATKSDKFRVIGGLHAVWCVFDQHSEDGVLLGYTPDLLDQMVGWTGLSSAMLAVGWLSFDGDQTLSLPEFEEHNGQSAKRRADDSKRKKVARSTGQMSAECPQNVRTGWGTEKEKDKSISTTNVVEKRGSRLPDDWLPDQESIRFCETERPDLQVSKVIAKFRDYWIAQPGRKGVKKDWPATWRNWVRNENVVRAQSRSFLDAQAETFAAFGGRSEEDVERDDSRTINV